MIIKKENIELRYKSCHPINVIRLTTQNAILEIIQSYLYPLMGQFPDIDKAINEFEQRMKDVE